MVAASSSTFNTMVFADGASSGNPGPGGWGSIVCTSIGQVTELGGFDPQTTNNKMELMAVIRGLEHVAKLRESGESVGAEIDVMTDSTYVIRGITQWIWGWRRNGWKTAEGLEVSNQEHWKRLSAVVATLGSPSTASLEKIKVQWKYVRGHSGIPGNERVDEIAVGFTKGLRPRLYSGPLLGYGVAIHDLPESFELPVQKPKAEPKAAAHSYLSLVGGVPMRHKSWAECERRVKGQSGAKFKKAMSASDEEKILASWGTSSSRLKS